VHGRGLVNLSEISNYPNKGIVKFDEIVNTLDSVVRTDRGCWLGIEVGVSVPCFGRELRTKKSPYTFRILLASIYILPIYQTAR